jgi:tetratricopeptide (TPR) repeat protein
MRRQVALAVLALLILGAAAGLAVWRYQVTRPDYRLERGRQAVRQENWEEVERLTTLLEESDAPVHAHLLRAESLFAEARPYLDREQQEPATPLLHRVLKELDQIDDPGPLQVDFSALAGLCFMYLGESVLAEQALTRVLEERPDHLDAHRGLATLYYDQGAMKKAIHHLEEVARLDPQDGRPFRLLGLIHKDMNHYSQAVACYKEALARHLVANAADDVRVNLAEVHVRTGDYKTARDVLKDCGTTAARGEPSLALRVQCAWELGEPGARELAERALRLHPESPRLLTTRARIHLADNQPKEAVELLEKALKSNPHDHFAHYQLAIAYEGVNEPEKADEQRRLALETNDLLLELTKLTQTAQDNPWDASVRLRLAEVCEKLDKKELAQMWRKASAACPPRSEKSR